MHAPLQPSSSDERREDVSRAGPVATVFARLRSLLPGRRKTEFDLPEEVHVDGAPQPVERSVDVPTDLAIALRLNRSGAEARRLTGKTVERRLDHCRSRFGLKHVSEDGSSAGLERRDARRVLLDAAIASGTVTLIDLRLLDPDDGE